MARAVVPAAQCATDGVTEAPMPIPVPSGLIDRSTPDDWAEWWRRFPSGTGPLPRKETQQEPLRPFDFTPPSGKRHPGERFVDVQSLLNASLISEDDVARQHAFTDEELRAAMETMANVNSKRSRGL